MKAKGKLWEKCTAYFSIVEDWLSRARGPGHVGVVETTRDEGAMNHSYMVLSNDPLSFGSLKENVRGSLPGMDTVFMDLTGMVCR